MEQAELKTLLSYDPLTGKFTWKVKPCTWINVGDEAGHVARNGYIQIRLGGTLYYGHRLAFLYMKGVWPPKLVDHDNRNRSDNSWTNLLEASELQNMRNCTRSKNNSSGVNGVLWDRQKNKWMAHITVNYKKKFLGYFDDIPAAAAARAAANTLHGFHANHGVP
jgi:hypothetical protein